MLGSFNDQIYSNHIKNRQRLVHSGDGNGGITLEHKAEIVRRSFAYSSKKYIAKLAKIRGNFFRRRVTVAGAERQGTWIFSWTAAS